MKHLQSYNEKFGFKDVIELPFKLINQLKQKAKTKREEREARKEIEDYIDLVDNYENESDARFTMEHDEWVTFARKKPKMVRWIRIRYRNFFDPGYSPSFVTMWSPKLEDIMYEDGKGGSIWSEWQYCYKDTEY